MPEHELNLASDLPQHLLQLRVGAAAKRTLEIAVLHERDGGLHCSQDVVARPDRRSKQYHGVVSVLPKRLVGVAIQPPLPPLRGGDDRMPARARGLRGVAGGGGVAGPGGGPPPGGGPKHPPPAPFSAPRALPLF